MGGKTSYGNLHIFELLSTTNGKIQPILRFGSDLVSRRLGLRRRQVSREEAAGTDHGEAEPVHLAF